MSIALRLSAALAVVAAPLVAQAAPEVSVGARAPVTLSVKDTSGKSRTLASLAGRSGTVLVFFRSARWCPYCQAQLKDLKALQGPLAQRGYSLAALSYDPPAALAQFASKGGVGYTLVSDEGSTVIDAFGLRDPSYPKGNFAHGVPRASIIVLDKGGKVIWKSVSADYKARPTNGAILAAAR